MPSTTRLLAPLAATVLGACVTPVTFASVAPDAGADGSIGLVDVEDAPRVAIDDAGGAAWTVVPLSTDAALRGVWASAPGDVWIVGEGGLAVHWDGASWSAPDTGTTGTLRAVWGSSATDVWMAGWDGVSRTLLLHWDGARFALDATIDDEYPVQSLWGSGPGDVWAVGGTVSAGLTEVLHFDGGSWARVPMDGQYSSFIGVGGYAHDDAWVVTDDDSADHWDGIEWMAGEERPGDGTLTGGVWADGPRSTWLTLSDGLVLHTDGEPLTPVMDTGANRTLHAIGGSGRRDVWTVGEAGALAHYDGADWALMPAPTPHALWAVWCIAPDEAWAVGDHGTVLHLAR